MLRDITIGQYYPKESHLHRLDPRTKLFGTIVFILTLFFSGKLYWYLVGIFCIAILYRIGKIPYAHALKGLKGFGILLLFTFCFRMISTPGTEVAEIWKFTITSQGIYKAVKMTARIALMILSASLLAYTTTPKKMADGLEKSCLFLEKIHVPVREMAVIVMIAFRFIPIMTEELNDLMDAQAARGVEFEKCSVWKKCKNMYTLLVPLFLNTIHRAADLAMAMEARGYSGDRPTSKMYPLIYTRKDYLAYAVVIIYLCCFIGINIVF